MTNSSLLKSYQLLAFAEQGWPRWYVEGHRRAGGGTDAHAQRIMGIQNGGGNGGG